MSIETIASRYSKSLIELGLQYNNLNEIYNDMISFKLALQNRDLLLMMRSPIVKSDKKQQVINAIFNNDLQKITYGFINLILKKGREKYLPQIVNEFVKQYNFLKKSITATVITAQPVDDAFLEKVKSKFPTGFTVQLSNEVDPSIIGGFVIKFGDTYYNASVAHHLKKIKSSFI